MYGGVEAELRRRLGIRYKQLLTTQRGHTVTAVDQIEGVNFGSSLLYLAPQMERFKETLDKVSGGQGEALPHAAFTRYYYDSMDGDLEDIARNLYRFGLSETPPPREEALRHVLSFFGATTDDNHPSPDLVIYTAPMGSFISP